VIAHTQQPTGGIDPTTGQTTDSAFDLITDPWVRARSIYEAVEQDGMAIPDFLSDDRFNDPAPSRQPPASAAA
jgi:hypothetical protein